MKLDDYPIFERKRWEFDTMLPKYLDLIFSDFNNESKKYEYLGCEIVDHYSNDVIKSTYKCINIKLKIMADEEVVRTILMPDLNYDNTFYINGNRNHPLFQIVDKPVVTNKSHIRVMSNLNLVLVEDNGMMVLYRSKIPIQEYILHNISFKSYLDKYKISYVVDKIESKKPNSVVVRIDDEKAYHVKHPEPKGNPFLYKFLTRCEKDSVNIPYDGTEKAYYLENFKTSYKKQFNEHDLFFDPIIKKHLGYNKSLHFYIMDAVAEPKKYDSQNYNNKRVRFVEWMLYPLIMKVREIILKTNKRATPEVVKKCCNFQQDILLSNLNKCGLMQGVVDANLIQDISYYTRCTLSGTQGIKIESASVKDRNVHPSQMMKVCPIDTSDGKNVGITRNLPININLDPKGYFTEPAEVTAENVLSIGVMNIPYKDRDDIVRLMMGSNQSKQAIPLVKPEVPIFQSGYESLIYKYGLIKNNKPGKIIHITENGDEVLIKGIRGKLERIHCLNNETIYTKPAGYPRIYECCVRVGDRVTANTTIFKMDNNVCDEKVANGINLLTAIKIDYNYEDAICLSESASRKLTSKHLYRLELVLTPDQALRPTIYSHAREPDIIPKIGDVINEGSIIAQYDNFSKSFDSLFSDNSKQIVAAKNYKVEHVEFYPNTKYCKHNKQYTDKISKYHKEKVKESEDLATQLRLQGIPEELIKNYMYNKRKTINKDKEFQKGNSIVVITLSYKEKLELGDKLSNRHGNKGVIAKILPDSEMPFLEDGKRVEMCINPLGIISRMNDGQVYEVEISRLVKDFGLTEFADASKIQLSSDELMDLYKKLNIKSKSKLFLKRPNGKTIEIPAINVGYMFMQKLYHKSDSKRKERSIGSYSTKSGRPVGGSSKIDGIIGNAQRVGEMEMLTIAAYGAENFIKELLTIKSSNSKARDEYITSILRGKEAEFDLSNVDQSQDLNVYMNALGFANN